MLSKYSNDLFVSMIFVELLMHIRTFVTSSYVQYQFARIIVIKTDETRAQLIEHCNGQFEYSLLTDLTHFENCVLIQSYPWSRQILNESISSLITQKSILKLWKLKNYMLSVCASVSVLEGDKELLSFVAEQLQLWTILNLCRRTTYNKLEKLWK